MRIIYSIAIFGYGLAIYIAQFFSSKAKLWIKGRIGWEKHLRNVVEKKPVIWIHAASFGEFEQGKPIIDYCFDKYVDHQIVVTFFSPSGFEGKKNYPKAHHILYLPLDTPSNAKYFVETLKPKLAIFVKYEFWFNFLNQCFKNNIPVIYFSSVFRPSQIFFKPFGTWFLNHLKKCTKIFVRDEYSLKLLMTKEIFSAEISGDTRFDTVVETSNFPIDIPDIAMWCKDNTLIVFGSTWPEDEQIFEKWIKENQKIKVIIAPHEIEKQKISALLQKFNTAALYSQNNFKNAQILILDKIGLLKYLYKLCTVCYIGGGFGKGIHNLLEPAAFGKPIIFGPKYHKFPEASDLLELNQAKSVRDSKEFDLAINNFLQNPNGQLNSAYVLKNSGANNKITTYIDKWL